MESPWTAPSLPDLGKRLLLWLGIPGIILTILGAAVLLRDSYAVGRGEYTADKVGYVLTAEQTRRNCQDIKQSTIDGHKRQITDITIRKAGAKPEVVAVMLELEDGVNQQIAKAEAEKAEC